VGEEGRHFNINKVQKVGLPMHTLLTVLACKKIGMHFGAKGQGACRPNDEQTHTFEEHRLLTTQCYGPGGAAHGVGGRSAAARTEGNFHTLTLTLTQCAAGRGT